MKTRFIILLTLLFTAVSFAQTVKENKKMLYYSFTGPSSVTELEDLKKDILLIEGVKEVKAECKAEKKAAQLRIIFVEPKRRHEGDPDFDIIAIKKLILKYNFVPGDFKIEDAE